MPIIRRDEGDDPLDKYIALIWSKKWLIAAIAVFAGILTYIALLFVPETYRVESEIYVNQLTSVPNEETANPETVASLLKSQSVIEDVRDDFVRAFELAEPPALEKFAKQFEVESTILQDTTVRKQYSPVLNLKVEATGSSATRFIMASWIENFIDEFGNYTTAEALTKKQAFEDEKAQLEEQIAKVEMERAQLDARLPYMKKMLAEKLELLTPSRLSFHDQDVDTVKLDFQVQNPRMRPGLLERYSELKLQVSTGSAPTTAASELRAMEVAISDAETSIAEAEKGLADLRYQQLQKARQLQLLSDTLKSVNDVYSRFTAAAAIYTTSSANGLPTGGDIRALATPVSPETRVWPKRTLTAGIVAIVAAVLTVFAILARNFLNKVSASFSQ